jgi:RecA-family ATPase
MATTTIAEPLPEINYESLEHQFGMRNYEQLKRLQDSQPNQFLIDGLIRHPSLVMEVGDSGIGKSPFNYQLLMCVVTGKPFLGKSVMRGRAIYMDLRTPLVIHKTR